MTYSLTKKVREKLEEEARNVLDFNYNGRFTKPAPNLYPHQWNWDAGFIALGYAHWQPERAWSELRHLFEAQWQNGMLPQIVFGTEWEARYFPGSDFWQTQGVAGVPEGVQSSGITMPPVHGFCVWQLAKLDPDKARVQKMLHYFYPKILALHQYLYTFRDPNEEGLVYIRHPWEAGTDNSPLWDAAMARIDLSAVSLPAYERQDLQNSRAAEHRPQQADYDRYVYLVDLFRKHAYNEAAIAAECPFKIQDPLFNSLLIWSNECLIDIGKTLKQEVTQLIEWNELSIYSMNEKLWNESTGLYDAYDLVSRETIACTTLSGLMPLVAPVPSQEQAERMAQTLCSAGFWGTDANPLYCVPTTRVDATAYQPERYWRGPVWINANWLLWQGLQRYGFEKMAKQVRLDSLELLARHGFFEYFDARRDAQSAAGYGTDQFSWSAALCLDFIANKKSFHKLFNQR